MKIFSFSFFIAALAFISISQAAGNLPPPPPLPELGGIPSITPPNSGTAFYAKPAVTPATSSQPVQSTTSKFPELNLPNSSSLPTLPQLPSLPGQNVSQFNNPLDNKSPFFEPPSAPATPPTTSVPKIPSMNHPIVAEEHPGKKKHIIRRPQHIVTIASSPSIPSYHRAIRLPATIYKKRYNPNNRHLPIVYYESDYNRLMFTTIERDDLDGLRTLLDEGRWINFVNAQGDTPLLAAVKHNAINTARLLLARHANPRVVDANGRSPLQIAKLNNNYAMLCALQTAGKRDMQASLP